MTVQRIRHKAADVLDQVETRNRVWNPVTLDWEVQTTEPQDNVDPLARYRLSDLDTSGSPQYFGFLDADGNWYIMELSDTTARYIKGTTDYLANWGNRAALTYGYFNDIF